MLVRATIDRLFDLPTEDRLALAEALWTPLENDLAAVPVPPWHLELLDERMA